MSFYRLNNETLSTVSPPKICYEQLSCSLLWCQFDRLLISVQTLLYLLRKKNVLSSSLSILIENHAYITHLTTWTTTTGMMKCHFFRMLPDDRANAFRPRCDLRRSPQMPRRKPRSQPLGAKQQTVEYFLRD